MGGLVQWLGEQYDEDERIARAADAELSNVFTRVANFDPEMATDERHIMTHRPARVLREIDAKRRMLAAFAPELAQADATIAGEWNSHDDLEGKLLAYLALPYADRPGYREEWRP